MTNEVYRNYINGEWVEGYDEIVNVNPSDTSDIVGRYAKANSDDCLAAIQAANTALKVGLRALLNNVRHHWT